MRVFESHQISDSSEVKYYIIIYCIVYLVWFPFGFVRIEVSFDFVRFCFGFLYLDYSVCCIVLYCIVLHCIVMHCIVLYIWFGVVKFNLVCFRFEWFVRFRLILSIWIIVFIALYCILYCNVL